MTTFYNCKHDGDQYRVSKFNKHLEVESSYLCTLSECECPAGHRPSCRHRNMLPKFIQRDHIGDNWFYDFDRGGWVQMDLGEPEPKVTGAALPFQTDGVTHTVAYMTDGSIQQYTTIEGEALPIQPIPVTELAPRPALESVQIFGMDDLLGIHNAIADAVGEPEARIKPSPSPTPTPTIRRRV